MVQKYFSREKSTIIIFILVAFHGIIYLTLFWTFGLVLDGKLIRCLTSEGNHLMNAIYEGFIVPNSHFIPIIANTLLNAILIHSIKDALAKRLELTAQSATDEHSRAKELSITNTIIVVQVIHFINYFPSGILWLIRALMEILLLSEASPDLYEVFYNGSRLALSLTALGHAVNFFIFLVKMPNFRKIFIDVKIKSQH